MESLQLSQVLADLSNLGAAEPEAAAAIVNANSPVIQADPERDARASPRQRSRPSSSTRRAWSAEAAVQPKFDKMGRRILISSPKSCSADNSAPGTPQPSNYDDDLERANTLMALYDIRAKLKQQDNSSLMRAREKINALAQRQQAQQFAELNMKKAEEMRRSRYSFPKV
ncbi:hypothetical protein Trco_005665 [Trichoderma cornu-damae]|uniref:Uncharacterized protein n=1 Tax=Trichoderma cornu-damae TaxID=654480 RepID=A0A9P8QPZ6_9HYPO|nr:hypothetical protein Trco_005665 [Trichoderma cornu-damae]